MADSPLLAASALRHGVLTTTHSTLLAAFLFAWPAIRPLAAQDCDAPPILIRNVHPA